jgi:hypothetical protein
MQAKFTRTLSFSLLLTLLYAAPAFAQIFGADDETLEKIFIGLKKINSRLINLETEELGSLKSKLENMLREMEQIKHALPQLQGMVEQNKSETLSGLNATNTKLNDLQAEVKNQVLSKIDQQNKILEQFRLGQESLKVGLAQDMEKFMQSNKGIVAVLTQDLIPALSNENNKTRQSMLEEIEKLKFSQKRLEGKLDELLSKTKNKKLESWNIYE